MVKAGSVKTKPLEPAAFIEAKVKSDSMGKITKKKIRQSAKALGLDYDDEKIIFAKKVLNNLTKEQ